MNTDQADRNSDALSMALSVLLIRLHYCATEASKAYHIDAANNPEATPGELDERDELLEMAELREQTVRHIIARYVAVGADPMATLAEYKSANDAESAAFADVKDMVRPCMRRVKMAVAARAEAARLCDQVLSQTEMWEAATTEQRARARRAQRDEFRQCGRPTTKATSEVFNLFGHDEWPTRADFLASVEFYADAGTAEVERLFEGR